MYTNIAFSQKDMLFAYERESGDAYTIGFKSMEDGKAIIFTIDNFSGSIPVNLASYLTKVDYCGDIDVYTKAEVAGYNRLMFFDGVNNGEGYTFIATGINSANGQSYLMTVSSPLDLSSFEVIERTSIDYLFISSIDFHSIMDPNTELNYVAFSVSNNYSSDRAIMMLSYDNNGIIEKLSSIDVEDVSLYDYYYNASSQTHYLMSGSTITILNNTFEVINDYEIYVQLDDRKVFNFDYRILYADTSNVQLLGRWINTKSLYLYNVSFEGNEIVPGAYDDTSFPDIVTYVLRKKINQNNKIIVSVSTNELDTPVNVPNTNYFWELDQDGKILKTYKFNDAFKKNMRITDIDENGILLGVGYEYVPDRNIFVILDEESSFLVGNQDLEDNVNNFVVYPNPNSGLFYINDSEFEGNVQIFNLLGQEVYRVELVENNEKGIDIGHLSSGQYYLIIKNKKGKQYSKITKI